MCHISATWVVVGSRNQFPTEVLRALLCLCVEREQTFRSTTCCVSEIPWRRRRILLLAAHFGLASVLQGSSGIPGAFICLQRPPADPLTPGNDGGPISLSVCSVAMKDAKQAFLLVIDNWQCDPFQGGNISLFKSDQVDPWACPPDEATFVCSIGVGFAEGKGRISPAAVAELRTCLDVPKCLLDYQLLSAIVMAAEFLAPDEYTLQYATPMTPSNVFRTTLSRPVRPEFPPPDFCPQAQVDSRVENSKLVNPSTPQGHCASSEQLDPNQLAKKAKRRNQLWQEGVDFFESTHNNDNLHWLPGFWTGRPNGWGGRHLLVNALACYRDALSFEN